MRRPPIIRASLLRPGELAVDSFAGGGGASTGLEAALGRPIDIAINHSATAIAMHKANHPETRHFVEDIWAVDPREACGSSPVGIAWFSPDCTHHSRARGGKPRDKNIRGLAWVVVRWARRVKPRVIVVENVQEFEDWGPLLPNGKPDPDRAGSTFRLWLNQLRGCGYEVDYRSLTAANYGTPTTRTRFFLVARSDRKPIIWPAETHGSGRQQPWRTAAEIIDWSLPCPSIFDRKKPLADATLRRIAEGIRRFVIECPRPFVLQYHGGEQPFRGQACDEPLRTVDTSNRYAVVAPFLAPVTHQGDARVHPVEEPVRTITAAHRGELALVAPTLIQTGYGERPGQTPRVPGLEKPLGTVVAGGSKHALVAAFLAKHYGGVVGHGLQRPIGTVTGTDHHSLVTAHITKFYGTSTGAAADKPLPTVTSGGGHGGGHLAEVRAFLIRYYGEGGQWQDARDPLRTVTAKARFGLVTVAGEAYQIVDIGLRMLQPPELFAAQGFPEDYVIDLVGPRGKPLTKSEQTDLAGNSVPPQEAHAIAAANLRGTERWA